MLHRLPFDIGSRYLLDQGQRGLSWNTLVFIAAALALIAYVSYVEYFSKPHSLHKLPPIKGITVDNKKWGTYRSHTYFGLRTRDPRSPLFGVMWYEQPDVMQRPYIRHWCDQGDQLMRYGWVAADGRTFGKQNITDKTASIYFEWINHEDTWTTKMWIDGLKGRRYSVIVYLVAQETETKFYTGHHLHDIISGRGPLLGDVRLAISSPQEKGILHSTLIWDDEFRLNQLNDLVLMNTVALESERGLVYQLSQQKPFSEGRFVTVQLNIQANTEIEISFATRRHAPKTGTRFNIELNKRINEFDMKFEDVFQLTRMKYTQVQMDMAKVALSNMLGSVGFWYGYNKVQVAGSSSVVSYGPHSLLSAVPSRPFFPRGFLWDEGFHNMLIRKFDPELSLEILVSWLNTMTEDGWIPREMILGEEAEAKVPLEYIVQRTNVANPPSLFYVIDKMVNDEKVVAKYGNLLGSMYPKLEKWYNWLRTSQAGRKIGTFRWRGRNATTNRELNPKTMASGLDDFPRASHPSKEEYHLDLRCWLALGSRVMNRLAKLYGSNFDQNKYQKNMEDMTNVEELVRLHWNEKHKAFFDYGRHSSNVKLERKPDPKRPGDFIVKRINVHEPHLGFVDDSFGYNSLFPLMLRLLPTNSSHLKHILNRLDDSEELWTDYGLRSLSRKSPYYAAYNTEHDPPYWRGYIWININYMVLSALKHYSRVPGDSQEIAERLFNALRKNLVTNMANQFNRTGYIWENYDDQNGEGRGSHPFNGWSSLVLMIMSDNLDA